METKLPITAEHMKYAAEKANRPHNVEDLLQEQFFDKNQTDLLLVATEKKSQGLETMSKYSGELKLVLLYEHDPPQR